ncbi:Calx-beta domain-containing protein [Paenibacillus nasutitermitis]|uniref:Calx-beta domain-containing protein n=1 Tax=Paenibacillus nasutitermitis TaxID=1652958 RepID=A0A916ZGE6_9BACL|nr:Calx-beta domain-containing protein [Paenibacillus nasutitermitis]GGD95122.1 hypothetical protein GCM10010911_62270 [Paenibacillus nasutitermitis]
MIQSMIYRVRKGLAPLLAAVMLVALLAAVMLVALLAPAFGQAAFATSPVELSFTAASQQVSENDRIDVAVRRTGGTTGRVQVNYQIKDGTAVAGKDYYLLSGSGTLTFDPGKSIKTFSISTINNYKLDGSRALTITLSNPTNGAVLGIISTTELTITDDERTEAGLVQFSQAEQTVYGKNAFYGETFTVLRTPGASGATTVSISSANGNAGAHLVTRDVTFAEGETEKKVFVHFYQDDSMQLQDGSFQLVLTAVDGGAAIGPIGTMKVQVVSRNATSGGEFKLVPEATDVYETAGQYEVKVSRQSVTANVYGGVSVDYEVIPGTASAGSDYTPVTGTLHFGENERDQLLSIPIADDSDIEGDEQFTIRLINPKGGGTLGNPSSLDITIMDDDDEPRAGLIEFEQIEYRITEPPFVELYNDVTERNISVTIKRSGGSDYPVTVDVATSDGTARDGHEYRSVIDSVYFPAGITVQKVMIPVYTTNADKTFHVKLSNPTGGASLGTADTANVTIIDQGFEGLKVSFNSPEKTIDEFFGSEDYEELNYFRIKFDYSGRGFSVDYTAIDGTAKNGEDFILEPATLKNNGEVWMTIPLRILRDNVKEPDESFTIKLSNPTNGYHLGDYDTLTITIRDDGPDATPGELIVDPAKCKKFGQTCPTSAPENDGELTVSVLRVDDYGWDQEVTVDYAAMGNGSGAGFAEEETDFEPVSGTLVFAPGEMVKKVTIPLVDDNQDEPTESFGLKISNPSAGARIYNNFVALQILDDDVVPAGKFQLPATQLVDESAGTLNIDISRTDGSEGTVTVDYMTSDRTAIAGKDYKAANGTLIFGPGEVAKTIAIPIIDDTIYEKNETFDVTLTNPTGGAGLVAGAEKTEVTIKDNDLGGTISFETPTYLALEESGPIRMKVIRSNGFEGTPTVHYSLIPVTAVPGEDYIDKSGTLIFNSSQKAFDIVILDDDVPEGPETFILKLSDPTGGAKLGKYSERLITIYDKDNISNPPGSLQVEPIQSINETDGTISLKVSRVNGSSGAVTVDYTTSDGTAAAGEDYTSVSGTLTFASGEWTKTITVPILNDNDEEGDEQFTVTLSNPTGGAKLTAGASSTVVTIKSNDHYGKLYFDTPTYFAIEETGPIHMKVLRQGGFDGPVKVHYSIIPLSATPGEDYTDISGTLTFAQGEMSRTFDIDILDDALPEDPESFILKLSDPEGGVKLGTPSERKITIYDKDKL